MRSRFFFELVYDIFPPPSGLKSLGLGETIWPHEVILLVEACIPQNTKRIIRITVAVV